MSKRALNPCKHACLHACACMPTHAHTTLTRTHGSTRIFIGIILNLWNNLERIDFFSVPNFPWNMEYRSFYSGLLFYVLQYNFILPVCRSQHLVFFVAIVSRALFIIFFQLVITEYRNTIFYFCYLLTGRGELRTFETDG